MAMASKVSTSISLRRVGKSVIRIDEEDDDAETEAKEDPPAPVHRQTGSSSQNTAESEYQADRVVVIQHSRERIPDRQGRRHTTQQRANDTRQETRD